MQRIKPESLTGKVLESLAGFVADTQLTVGDRLPPERDIARQLGVSRALVREALQRWLVLGYIERINGRGTFLTREIRPNSRIVVVQVDDDLESLRSALEIRRALEPEAAALAARRASEKQVLHLRHLLANVEAAYQERGDAPAEDWLFHQAIYEASGNPLFIHLINSIRDSYKRFWENPVQEPNFARRGLAFHRELVSAIANRDPDLAREATLRILQVLEEDLHFETLPSTENDATE